MSAVLPSELLLSQSRLKKFKPLLRAFSLGPGTAFLLSGKAPRLWIILAKVKNFITHGGRRGEQRRRLKIQWATRTHTHTHELMCVSLSLSHSDNKSESVFENNTCCLEFFSPTTLWVLLPLSLFTCDTESIALSVWAKNERAWTAKGRVD